MEVGSQVFEFTLEKVLRKTGIKEVCRARTPEYAKVCIKLVRLNDPKSASWRVAEEEGANLQAKFARCDARVVDVIDMRQTTEFFVVIQEYVEGVDLGKLVYDKGPLPLADAVRIACDLLDSVSRWRSLDPNFSHNDLTLENIRITADAKTRILDFGIAKSRRCQDGTLLAFRTLIYTPLDRLKRNVSDSHTDLYSIAVILYLLLSGGQPPYLEDGQGGLIFAEVPPRPADCPQPLYHILRKELSHNPAGRYTSPDHFRRDLLQFLGSRPVSPGNEVWSRPTVQVCEPTPTVLVAEPSAAAGSHTPAAVKWGGWPRRQLAIICIVLLGIAETAALLRPTYARRTVSEELNALTRDWSNEEKWHRVPLLKWSPNGDLTARTKAAAASVLADYRTDYPAVSGHMWSQLAALLDHIQPADAEVRFYRTMAQAHLARLRRDHGAAILSFQSAATIQPGSPDPYVGLSRVYSAINDLERLKDSQREAAAHGHQPGKREAAQLADAYHSAAGKVHGSTRDEVERRKNLLLRARDGYEKSAGYGEADQRREIVNGEIRKCDRILSSVKQ
jgi:hypothetical protein